MKRSSFILSLAVVLSWYGASQPAYAKGSTEKMVIRGGGLKNPLTVTDPRVLQQSNIWMANFLEGTKNALNQTPQIHFKYEVTLYPALIDRSVAPEYVFYYSPAAAGAGLIYLPGKADAAHNVNWGLIMHPERDGKWSYASAKWERLIKPLINRALTENQ